MDTVFSLTALVWRSNEKTETPKKWLIGMLSTRDDIINSILCSTRNIPNTYFKLSGDVSTIIWKTSTSIFQRFSVFGNFGPILDGEKTRSNILI